MKTNTCFLSCKYPAMFCSRWLNIIPILAFLIILSCSKDDGVKNENLASNLKLSPDSSLPLSADLIAGGTQSPEIFDLFAPALFNIIRQKSQLVQKGQSAWNDAIRNFWVADLNGGHIAPTWRGFLSAAAAAAAGASASEVNNVANAISANGSRGGVWDRSTLFYLLYVHQKIFGGTDDILRMKSDWAYFKTLYKKNEIIACGKNSVANFATDDTAWNSMYYLKVYEITADREALDFAIQSINCAYSHFAVSTTGSPHGLWYSDDHIGSSLYEVGLALAAWQVYLVTQDSLFYSKAIASYTWMQRDLQRSDGIYWADYDLINNVPPAANRPDDIHVAGSVTFLAGNMGMAVLNARLYARTANDIYRERAVAITKGILTKLVDSNGVLINDRDAWTNGSFVNEFVSEVIPLAGVPVRMRDVIYKTSESIVRNARTSGGFYGGDWSGGTAWSKIGSLPQQIYTSTSTIGFVFAAALLTKK